MAGERVERRLAAILAADVVGYSRMISIDEAGTLSRLRGIRLEIVNPVIAEHGGRIFKLMGDGLLAEFPSAVQAVRAAIAIQARMGDWNRISADGKPMEIRIGVHQGDVVVEGRDLLGDGVNVAARLETLAEPGGVCISARVHEDAAGKINLQAKDMGEQKLKNIDRPVRAYRILPPSEHPTPKAAVDHPTLPLPDKPSIAVLPFQNMSVDPEQEYFADGIVEDIITGLSRVGSLFVIARNSSFTYKGKPIDVRQIGQDLGVRYVLEGSIRKAGSRIRVTGQLVETTNGRHIWTERYDRELTDIFEIQDELTRAVVASVQTQVEIFEGEIISRDRLDVWSLTKRAWRRILDLELPALEEAMQLGEEAMRLDRRSARAHAVVSVALHHLGLMGGGPDAHQKVTRARDLARAAIELDERDEFAHWAYGNARQWLREGDHGISAYERALELNPNYSLAYGLLGSALCSLGRTEESILASLVAIRSNPRDPSNFFRYSSLAWAHFIAGRFSEAVEWAQKSIDRKKQWWTPHLLLIASLAQLDRMEEAESAVTNYLRVYPNGSLRDANIAWLSAARFAVSKEKLLLGLRKAGLPE